MRLSRTLHLALAVTLAAARAVMAGVATGPSAVEETPALAIDDAGRIHLVTVETGDEVGRVVAVFRVEAGERTRVATLEVPGATGLGRPVAVGLAEGVLVAWATQEASGAYRVAVARAREGAAGTPLLLAGDGTADILPALARVGDRVGIAWESNGDDRGRSIRFAWIGADGAPSAPVVLSVPGWSSGNPSIVATTGGAVFACWESFRDGGYDLFGAWWRDGGWSPERRLTTDPRIDRHARLASHDDAVWLAWESSAYDGNQPLDVRDHDVRVARVTGDGSLHETRARFARAALAPPLWPAGTRPEDPAFETGLFRPHPTFDRAGRLWVTARQAIGRHAGWAPVVRFYEGDGWSEARVPIRRAGRWHPVPAVASGDAVVVAAQSDEQPASLAPHVHGHGDWPSRVEVARLEASGAVRPFATAPFVVAPHDFAVHHRERASNARQPRQTRHHGGRILQLFWGNLHAHSAMSPCNRAGNPPPLDVLTIERDLDRLDFCALTDHDFAMDRPMWRHTQELVGQYRDPGRFLTLLGQEWTSGVVPPAEHGHPGEPPMFRHGHHNLIFRNPRYPRFFDAFRGQPSPADVAAEIGGEEFVLIPHGLADWQMRGLGNPPVDWSNTDEVLLPIAEVYQRRGSYECLGCPLAAEAGAPFRGHYLQDAWAAGVVIGVIASPDHGGGEGYAGVWAPELTEAALFEAFRARHTFGTTGEKIALFVASGEAMMGDKVRRPASGDVPLDVAVAAGAEIEDVVVLRNNVPVFTHPGGGTQVEFQWTDADPPADGPLWYYVRATVGPDAEGGRVRLAWSSPIWFFDEVPPPRRFRAGAAPAAAP